MPSLVTGTEWTIYYTELARALDVRIDSSGPNFGSEEMLKTLAASSTLATFAGIYTRPSGLSTTAGLKLIPLCDPTPVYPHSLVCIARTPTPHSLDCAVMPNPTRAAQSRARSGTHLELSRLALRQAAPA
jgi:hypothetical protein